VSVLAPLAVSTYKRLGHLRATLAALARNERAHETELYVFSDAPRPGDEAEVAEVRRYLRTVEGFRRVEVWERPTNGRIANARGGLRSVLERHGRVVYLEEDVLTAPGFLTFVNQGLDTYRDRPDVFAICGYTAPIRLDWVSERDVYLLPRFSGWGIGLWADRFARVPARIADYEAVAADSGFQRRLARQGDDMPRMLADELAQRMDAWDVRAIYVMARDDLRVVAPTVSLTHNAGHDGTGVHCGTTDRYRTDLTLARTRFHMPRDLADDPWVIDALRRFRGDGARWAEAWDDRRVWTTLREVERDHVAAGDPGRLDRLAPALGKNLVVLLGAPGADGAPLACALAAHSEVHAMAAPWLGSLLGHVARVSQGDDPFRDVPGGPRTYLEALRDLAEGLHAKARALSGASRVLHWAPGSCRALPELAGVFPRAKLVFLLRNPLDVLAGLLRTRFAGDVDALGAERAWRQDLLEGPRLLMDGITALGEDAIVVHHESLAARPEATLRAVCARLGLDFEPAMLPRGPAEDADRWLTDLIDADAWVVARQYLQQLGPDLIARMGYDYRALGEALMSAKAMERVG